MCTVSWIRSGAVLEVLFNRDERRSRAPASPARADACRGVRFVAPRDGDFGGTWTLANEHGVVLCLLNYYQRERPAAAGPFTSRGLLVLDLAGAPSAAAALAGAAGRDLDAFQPFTLLAFDGAASALVQWDGAAATARDLAPAESPFVSSAFDVEAVRQTRRAALERLADGTAIDGELLERFHRSHEPRQGSLSPCMHRAEAATQSLTRIAVDERTVRVAYTPGRPCRTAALDPVLLERR